MTTPSPFMVARETSNNFGSAFSRVKDENAIDRILSEAMGSGNPEEIQNSIGKILSQVSPERQGLAVQYLQSSFNNLKEKQERERKLNLEKQAAQEAGYTYGAPPQVAAQQVKDKAKMGRLAQYGLGVGDANTPSNLPNVDQQTPANLGNDGKSVSETNSSQPGQSIFKKLSKDQLIVLTGSPDREVAEPAKAELRNRQEKENLDQKEKETWTKLGIERAKKVLDKAEEIAQSLPVKKTALKLMTDSIANKNLGFWTPDNLAEVTGIEAFRSPEGALFKTAGKEYFLGNISRAGARPNQWIEQQIADMMTKIGRSTEANLSVSRALQNETDLDEERVRLTEEVFKDLRSQGKDVGDLGTEVNKRLAKYAEQKQNELFNDLRAIKAIGEGKPQKFHKVAEGTQISSYMVDALLNAFSNDPDKAMQEAKKLGYSFE